MLIEPERPTDVAAIHDVVAAAFTDEPGVADLVSALRDDASWPGGLSFVAREEHGAVIGHVSFTWSVLSPSGARLLQLSPLSVRPDRQRVGVGSALVRHGLAVTDTRDEPGVAVEGAPLYYGRFGFGAAEPQGVLRPSPDIPDWAFQVRWRPGAGPVRGRLTYAAPFALYT